MTEAIRDFAKSCFSSPLNAAITIAIAAWLAVTVPEIIRWAILDAVWQGSSPKACAGVESACWIFIKARANSILFGTYPVAEQWRVELAGAIMLASVLVLLIRQLPHKIVIATVLLFTILPICGVVVSGGVLGLTPVPTERWGGLMLTVALASTTIVCSIPTGLLLALGRRSEMPVVRILSAGYIDIMRSLPLLGVLYLAIILFPIFVPPGVEISPVARAIIALTLFNAASLAEVFRGGLQSVAKGQYEAGAALGMRGWQTMLLIVLPQAITASLPGLVNICVEIIKETTIVLIVGLFDVLGILQAGITDPNWLVGPQVRTTAYFFAGLLFWSLCFGLSRFSAHIEHTLSAGRRH